MMAHAIDIACPDARPAPRARGARAIGPWTRRRGATRPGHSVARGGLQLCRDRRDDGRELADDRLVEAALREGRPGRLGRPSSRLDAQRADAGAGSADHDVDATAAAPWGHPLVDAIARPQTGGAAHDHSARLAPRQPAAPSTRAV